MKTWAFYVILPGDPSFPSKKLFRFQVCGVTYCSICVGFHVRRTTFKVSRTGQKTWQRGGKKPATWKDNKYQQTKEEMERATRSKRKTHVTIWWWPCWSWCPQELNSLGSLLVSVVGSTTTPGGHAGWGRRAWAGGAYGETKYRHQSRFSPKTSKWHIFSFTKRKGKLGSLNPFKSRLFFDLLFFLLLPFPRWNVHSGSKFVFGFLESTLCKKNTSPNSTQTMIKRRNSWRMLGKTSPNATRPKKN